MLKNVLANWSFVFVSMLAVFILYPFFLKTLGEEQYGVWLLISSATGYFSLLQMGVPMANVRFISRHYARNEYEQLNEVVCTNLFFFTMVGIVIFFLGFGLANLLEIFFVIPPEFARFAKFATLVACLEIAIRFSFEVFEGFFHAKQQFVVFNIIKNLMIFVRIGATFTLVKYENGLVWVAFVLLIITIVQSFVFYVYIRMNNGFLTLHYKFIKMKVFKEIFGYSVFVLLLQLGARISFNTDALVLGSVVSVSAVVWFNIGNNLLLYFSRLISGVSSALMPKISVLEAQGNLDDISEIYCKYSRLVMFFVLPVCLFFWCFGGDFIALWMGEKYRVLSGAVLSILTIGYLFYLVQSGVAIPILMGTSNVKYPTFIIFLSAIINLILSIFLGKIYGVYGVAWGTTVPLLGVTLAMIIYICRTFKVHFFKYVLKSLLIPLLASLPLLMIYQYFKNVEIVSYFDLGLFSSIGFFVYFITIYSCLLSTYERHQVFSFFSKMRL